MNTRKLKKAIILNLPYVFLTLLATKLSAGWRLTTGADFAQKIAGFTQGLGLSSVTLPSFHPIDLTVGCALGLLVRIIVHVKGKNARKFRKNMEYGSARWGKADDIQPFVDPVFANNIILTKTKA